jgi:glycolate oxidase iron-sulfur subunit
MDASEVERPPYPSVLAGRDPDAPAAFDLDKCVHCGLCLGACPTYRELGLEMDSPRGRVYQMVQVATGQMEMGPSYLEHIGLCLACRACETACPSGVPYGRMIEAARTEIQDAKAQGKLPQSATERLLRSFVFGWILPSPGWLRTIASLLWFYKVSGVRALVEGSGVLKLFGKLGRIEPLTPPAQLPSFFSQYGRVFPAEGERRYRVALLGGCIANIFFARLHEATVRVLVKNGCEVHVPAGQTCCGALQVHTGERERARALARTNIDALLPGDYDAIISNTAGCGSTLKEYHELLEHDPAYAEKARQFVARMRDVNDGLAAAGLTQPPGRLEATVTYQDSCHLLHGQKIRNAPRHLLAQIPGVELKELPYTDICCGSAGIYNVVQDEMAAALLERKLGYANSTGATIIATANPGCMLQLRAGVARHGHGQRVMHVIEVLDEAYGHTPARPA